MDYAWAVGAGECELDGSGVSGWGRGREGEEGTGGDRKKNENERSVKRRGREKRVDSGVLTMWSLGVRVEYVIRDSKEACDVADDIGAKCLSGGVFRKGKGGEIIEVDRASRGLAIVRRKTMTANLSELALAHSSHSPSTQRITSVEY